MKLLTKQQVLKFFTQYETIRNRRSYSYFKRRVIVNIKKENNLIKEAFEVEADEIGFCLDQKWGDYENPYENSDTALAFNLFKKGWQAAKVQANKYFEEFIDQAIEDSACADERRSLQSLLDEFKEQNNG